MKKLMGLFSVLSLFLITGCYIKDGSLYAGHETIGSLHTKEEIIQYIDNLSNCGKDRKENCNLLGKYTVISSNEEVDKNGEISSRKVNFKLNDYDIEFSAESVSVCDSEFSGSCIGKTWEIETDYVNNVRTYFKEKFMNQNNMPNEYIKEVNLIISRPRGVYEKDFELIIKNKKSVPIIVNYISMYVDYINKIQKNNDLNFDLFDDTFLIIADGVRVSPENPRPSIIIAKNNNNQYSAYLENANETNIEKYLYNYLEKNKEI